MREKEVKRLVVNWLATQREGLIVDELQLCRHAARADLVLVDEHLEGFEIKSQYDTLERLVKQVEIYDRVFRFSSLVVAAAHLRKATRLIPDYWGIFVVTQESTPQLTVFREKTENTHVCGTALSELLWTNELLAILSDLGVLARESWSRKKLRCVLANNLEPTALSAVVSQRLKLRQHWRAA